MQLADDVLRAGVRRRGLRLTKGIQPVRLRRADAAIAREPLQGLTHGAIAADAEARERASREREALALDLREQKALPDRRQRPRRDRTVDLDQHLVRHEARFAGRWNVDAAVAAR